MSFNVVLLYLERSIVDTPEREQRWPFQQGEAPLATADRNPMPRNAEGVRTPIELQE